MSRSIIIDTYRCKAHINYFIWVFCFINNLLYIHNMKQIITIIIFIWALCVYLFYNNWNPLEIDIHPVIRSYEKNDIIWKIWYQIIIDRRRNGNTGNDKPFLPIRQYISLKTWEITPRWNDRYSFSKLEKNYINNQNFDTWWKQRHFESDLLRSRTYGWDFDWIIEKIPYLKDLSVDFIYINSPFESNSAMGYDTVDLWNINTRYILKDIDTIRSRIYNNISPSIISDANLSFIHLTNTLHEHNIKIIVDVAFFYTALQSNFYNDILQKWTKSKYRERFDVFTWIQNSWVDMKNSDYCKNSEILWTKSQLYEIYYLPRWKFCETGPRIKVINDSYHPDYIKYITNSLNFRSDDNNNLNYSWIDGLRLDVFPELSTSFLQQMRKKFSNKLFFIAEDRWDTIYSNEKKQTYDTITNYEFRSLIEHMFFNDNEIDQLKHTEGFTLRMIWKNSINTILQYWNVLWSHDTSRIRSQFIKKNQSAWMLDLKWDLSYKTRLQDWWTMINSKPEYTKSLNGIQAILWLQSIFPWSTMIYYWDEVGMRWPDDPSNRQPMLWDDINFEKQSLCVASTDHYCDPLQLGKRTGLKINNNILNDYKKINTIKSHISTLKNWDFHIWKAWNNFIIHRRSQTSESWYIYNFTNKSSKVNIPFSHIGQYKEIRTNQWFSINEPKKKSYTIPWKWSILIYKE